MATLDTFQERRMAVGVETIYFRFLSPLGATTIGQSIQPYHRVLRRAQIGSNVMMTWQTTITILSIKYG
tara:strand:- start:68 stop:274 length:207 start_codon:yes stop_codon:yes gene_type:complete